MENVKHIYNRKILIVDDVPQILEAYSKVLNQERSDILNKGNKLFKTNYPEPKEIIFELTSALNGSDAIKRAKELKRCGERFTVAFIDMKMDGLDGAETATKLWEIDPYIKIVIVTAYNDVSLKKIIETTGREEIFYHKKPFNSDEIKQFAVALNKQWNIEREKELLLKEIENSREKEIDTAFNIQETLLSGMIPENFPGISLSYRSSPAKGVNGDFFDFYSTDDKSFDLITGDVMGKGVPAALTGAAAKMGILYNLFKLKSQNSSKPEDIISKTSFDLTDKLEELNSYITLNYSRFNLKDQTITYVDCGHPKVIHYNRENNRINMLEGENMPIGFQKNEIIKQITTSFAKGDLFVFYSDGLSETRSKHGDLFGEEKIMEIVNRSNGKDTAQILMDINSSAQAFSELEYPEDDLTIIVIKIEGGF